MNTVCEVFENSIRNTFILNRNNTNTTVRELPGSFVMMTDFEASWPVIDSDFK